MEKHYEQRVRVDVKEGNKQVLKRLKIEIRLEDQSTLPKQTRKE